MSLRDRTRIDSDILLNNLEEFMTRTTLLVLPLLVTIAAPAAAQTAQGQDARPLSLNLGISKIYGSPAAPVVYEGSSLAQPGGSTPSLTAFGTRRRGSMVGYIEDTMVGSKVRVRFDAGMHNRAPDRAEFFYGKCGCYRDLPTNQPAYDPNAAGPGPGIV